MINTLSNEFYQNDATLNYKNVLDELMDYKKEYSRLKSDLEAKEREKLYLISQINELKNAANKTLTENKNLKIENNNLINENKSLEEQINDENEKYNKQLDMIKNDYEKKVESIKDEFEFLYKQKYLEEAEKKYKNSNKEKDIEINGLNDKIYKLEKEKLKIENDYENYKTQTQIEIDNLKVKNNNDLKLMNEKLFQSQKINLNENGVNPNVNSNNDILFSELKLQLTNSKNEINKLNSILNEHKSQNNKLLISLINTEQTKNDEISGLKFKNNLQQNQIIDLSTKVNFKEKELIDIQSKYDVMCNTYKNMEKSNEYLIKENSNIKTQYNEIQEKIVVLTNLINMREREMIDTINKVKDGGEYEDVNSELQKLRELTRIRENEYEKLNNNYNVLQDEKKILINKINDIQQEMDLNKYYGENGSFKGGDNEKEIKNLNKLIEKLKKDNYYDKYKTMLEKKNYYKEQCKLCNQKVDIILSKLNKNQIQEIEKDINFKKLNTLSNNIIKNNEDTIKSIKINNTNKDFDKNNFNKNINEIKSNNNIGSSGSYNFGSVNQSEINNKDVSKDSVTNYNYNFGDNNIVNNKINNSNFSNANNKSTSKNNANPSGVIVNNNNWNNNFNNNANDNLNNNNNNVGGDEISEDISYSESIRK